MRYSKKNWFKNLGTPIVLVIIAVFVLIPWEMSAQDITPEEFEKAQQIRENLIQRGLLEVQSDNDVPIGQLSSDDPIIQYSEYANNRLSVNTDGSRASDFKDDGKRFYILGRESLTVSEYHLSSSWDIESADFERDLDISSEMGTQDQSGSVPNGLYIRKSDGEKMWIFNRTEIWEYTLSTPWNISSASPTGYKDLSEDVVRGHDIEFKPNGRVLYVDDRIAEVVFQFDLSSSWDIETATLDYALDISDEQQEVRGTQLSPDGRKMFLMDTARQDVLEYYLSDPFDLSSASFIGSYSVASESSNPRGLTFKPDLSRFYVTDNTEDRVYEYRVAIVDADESSISSSKDKVVANGSAESRISVILRDPSGNRIGGREVSLSSNSSNSSIDAVNRTTDSSGEARFDVSNSAAEKVTFTASSMGVTIDETASIEFATIDAGESAVGSSREKVLADGSAASRITVIARDEDGDRLEGVRISLSANSSNVNINNVRRETDSNGEAMFDVSNTVAESVTFTVSGLGVTIDQKVTVRYVTVDAEESSVVSSQQKVHANGVQSSTITVTARDEDGDELEDVEISLIPNEGSSKIEAINKSTNSDGEAKFRVTNSTAQVVTYQARGFGVTINDEVTVNFTPIDPDESEVEISREKVLANDNAEAIITVSAKDEDGENFSNVKITLQQNGGNSTITKVQEITDSDGRAIFHVKNNDTGEITYSAKAMGITISQTVSAKFVTVDPNESTISVNPENVQANGEDESQITVTTRDEDGDALQGARVVLDDLNGSSVINDSEIITDSDGKAVFKVRSETPQIVNYRISAEDIEFPDNISVGFIPIAPVALSASEVQTREFQANWEIVDGADSYLIDVSTDSSFSSLVAPYDKFDTGNVTSFTVENIAPGTTYLYRVRATSDGLIGANSQTIQTTTFPDVPQAVSASDRNALKFTANWNEAEGARKYKLDVSRDASFNNILANYNNLDVGTATNYTVTNLMPGQIYYYRVRSEAGPRVSISSNVIETSTLTISSDQSEIVADQLKVLANGDQANELHITVKSDEGILLEGLNVVLEQTEGNSEIEEVQSVTNDKGVAIFEVTSLTAGKSTYNVSAADITIGEISVEFLQNDGVLRLGNNFPNPFLINSKIPVTIPRPMNVNLTIYNSIGVPVRTLRDEQVDTGYFEIPFDGADLASGVYFYRLVTEDGTKTGKMVLVK